MSALARESRISREILFRSLSVHGNSDLNHEGNLFLTIKADGCDALMLSTEDTI
jgi:DNA-binding phage protein